MKIALFLLLFCQVVDLIKLNNVISDNNEAVCNFQQYDAHIPEAFPRTSAPRSKGCGGKLLSLRKIYVNIDGSQYNLFGANNIVDLMYCRIGQCELHWDDREKEKDILDGVICEFHFEELFTKWESRFSGHVDYNKERKLTCLYNNIFDTADGKKCPNLVQRKIEKEDATIFVNENIVIQLGAGFCKRHFEELKEMIKGRSEVPNLNIAETNNDRTSAEKQNDDQDDCMMENNFDGEQMGDYDGEPGGDYSEEEYIPETSFDAQVDGEDAKNLRKFAKPLGVERIVTQGNYDNLGEREKRFKVSGGRKLLKRIFEIMAPQCEEDFGAKVCQIYQIDEKVVANPKNDLMDAIATQYYKTTDKRMRKIILGPMADTCSFDEVKTKIPGLSRFLFRQAKRCFDFDELPEDLPKHYDRIDRPKIRVFMEFFTSPLCMIVLPYGEMKIKLSSGEKVDVAANIRIQANAQIIRMFERKMTEENRQNELLPRSTMFAILQHCYAKQSTALTCVDYFQAAALDGFDELKKILTKWTETGNMDLQQSDTFQKQLKDAQQYLQNDYSISLKQNDEIISHCFEHALSDPDPDDVDFSASCQPHLKICSRCKAMHDVIENLVTYSKNLVSICKENNCPDQEDFEISDAQIINAVYHVEELKSHILRARWADKVRAEDISNLEPGRAYITMDWGHKLLPMKFRETQKDFFGKEGMAHHITHVQTVKDGIPAEYAFVHIIEKNKQDSTAVAAIILDVLKNLKKISINSVILASDNAGCYHSKELMLSLPEISKQSGVIIEKYAFSEPQNGKSSSDRSEALLKNKVRRHVNEGNNARNEIEFYNALLAFPVLSNTTFSVSTVNRACFIIHPKSLVGIAKYYSFTFQDRGILVHRAANIGNGRLFKFNKKINTPMTNIPTLTKSLEHNDITATDVNIWRSPKAKKENAAKNNECPVFECPEPTCDFTCLSHEELTTHVMAAKHQQRIPERLLQNDYVIKEYQQMVKQLSPKKVDKVTAALQNEQIEENTIDITAGPKKGWGHQKSRTLPEITDEKREFVREKFNEGAKDKARKWKPKEISTAMFNAKKNGKRMFDPTEVLLPEQIQPMLSRFAAEQRKAVNTPTESESTKRVATTDNIQSDIEYKRKRRQKRSDDISESAPENNIQAEENWELYSNSLEDGEENELINRKDVETEMIQHINIASRALRYQRNEEIELMYYYVDQNSVNNE